LEKIGKISGVSANPRRNKDKRKVFLGYGNAQISVSRNSTYRFMVKRTKDSRLVDYHIPTQLLCGARIELEENPSVWR